jgi:hypothetical protein
MLCLSLVIIIMVSVPGDILLFCCCCRCIEADSALAPERVRVGGAVSSDLVLFSETVFLRSLAGGDILISEYKQRRVRAVVVIYVLEGPSRGLWVEEIHERDERGVEHRPHYVELPSKVLDANLE